PRNSEGLFLMQRLRDEAHRFAITYHRSKRAKAMTSSVLDDIPGLGESKRTALLRHFGSVKKVRAATAEEICEGKGIGPAMAGKIVEGMDDWEGRRWLRVGLKDVVPGTRRARTEEDE